MSEPYVWDLFEGHFPMKTVGFKKRMEQCHNVRSIWATAATVNQWGTSRFDEDLCFS